MIANRPSGGINNCVHGDVYIRPVRPARGTARGPARWWSDVACLCGFQWWLPFFFLDGCKEEPHGLVDCSRSSSSFRGMDGRLKARMPGWNDVPLTNRPDEVRLIRFARLRERRAPSRKCKTRTDSGTRWSSLHRDDHRRPARRPTMLPSRPAATAAATATAAAAHLIYSSSSYFAASAAPAAAVAAVAAAAWQIFLDEYFQSVTNPSGRLENDWLYFSSSRMLTGVRESKKRRGGGGGDVSQPHLQKHSRWDASAEKYMEDDPGVRMTDDCCPIRGWMTQVGSIVAWFDRPIRQAGRPSRAFAHVTMRVDMRVTRTMTEHL